MSGGVRRVGRAATAILLAGVLAPLASGCGAADASAAAAGGSGHAAHGATHHDAAAHRGPGAADPAQSSLYLLQGAWTDQAGGAVELGDLAGRPVVMAMVYTHCSYACPRIVAQMKWLAGELAAEGHPDAARFVLVSIDPERDTPERMAAFAEATRLDPARWTLLNGPDDDVLALSVLLGVKYRAAGEGEFAHSNVLTILDAHGVPAGRVEGLSADLDPALATLRSLLP